MALATALARAATRLLPGGLHPFAPEIYVPSLSLRINRQLFDASAAKETPAPEEDESWKEAEAVILRDVEPILELVRKILHSGRYGYGGFISPDDQEVVVEKLLSHHPHSEEKIGCGVDAIMVDRHPNYKSKCLFVLRTNGDLEDFSYRKCLRAYLEGKYPSHADKFLQKHLVQRRRRSADPEK